MSKRNTQLIAKIGLFGIGGYMLYTMFKGTGALASPLLSTLNSWLVTPDNVLSKIPVSAYDYVPTTQSQISQPKITPPVNISTSTKSNTSGQPLGIRNNNPGNIKYSAANNWIGQIGRDGDYVVFSTPVYGFRTLFYLIKKYINSYGLNTIRKIGTRWDEKNAVAWSNNAASISGLGLDTPLDFNNQQYMVRLAVGMVGAENGASWSAYYSGDTILAGYRSA